MEHSTIHIFVEIPSNVLGLHKNKMLYNNLIMEKNFCILCKPRILGWEFAICGYPRLSSNWMLTMFSAKIGPPCNMILTLTYFFKVFEWNFWFFQDPVQTLESRGGFGWWGFLIWQKIGNHATRSGEWLARDPKGETSIWVTQLIFSLEQKREMSGKNTFELSQQNTYE